ncbi:expressed unknown protein [Seminavis robusta]|uniref:Uncharacterized protein n=1 Tax=Seminavis robusta TaxID=568900 RepID=A0A9N8EPZ4_9STRA|nr:expressed unknown protein [Seminavis robusta]|eukprot:Sro1633_g287370.1 n/a (197) ;mRNA; r:9603-10193
MTPLRLFIGVLLLLLAMSTTVVVSSMEEDEWDNSAPEVTNVRPIEDSDLNDIDGEQPLYVEDYEDMDAYYEEFGQEEDSSDEDEDYEEDIWVVNKDGELCNPEYDEDCEEPTCCETCPGEPDKCFVEYYGTGESDCLEDISNFDSSENYDEQSGSLGFFQQVHCLEHGLDENDIDQEDLIEEEDLIDEEDLIEEEE